MITFFPEDKAFQILLGYGDVGIGQCDGGPEDKSGYIGVAFTQLSRPYGKDEPIPDSEKDHEGAFKVILSIRDEAGYASLHRAVKKLGSRQGVDKYTMGDKLYDNLMDDLGAEKQKAEKAEYYLKEMTEKHAALTKALQDIVAAKEKEDRGWFKWRARTALGNDISSALKEG